MNKLTEDDIIGLNIAICDKVNEQPLLINRNGLLSALSILDNDYYNNENEQIAAFFRSLIVNHPFKDGNKRTANIAIIIMKKPICSRNTLIDITMKIAIGELNDYCNIAKLLWG